MKPIEPKVHHDTKAVWFRRKRGVLALVGMIVTILCATSLNAAVTFVAPEWKAHFRTNLVIANCVFQETLLTQPATNLYHARYQEHAFLLREIGRPEDAFVDHIIGGSLYAGQFGSNYWAIEGGRVLKRFPDADAMIREFRNPEVSLIEAPRRKLIGALFYGFHLLDPDSVEWVGEFTFKASSFRNYKFRGKIRDASNGLPTVVEWYAEADPLMHFTTEYKYLKKLGLPYYPSEIFVKARVNEKMIPVVKYRILSLETSPQPLPESAFASARYFSAPASSFPQVLMITNDQFYSKNASGVWEEVQEGPLPDLSGKVPTPKLSKALILGFVVLSAMPLFIAWRHASRARRQHSNKTQ